MSEQQEQESVKFFDYSERLNKIQITNTKIDRERDKLVATLRGLKMPMAQLILSMREMEDEILAETKDPVNNMSDWTHPVNNYLRTVHNLVILEKTQKDVLVEILEKVINITNEIEIRNVAAENLIEDEVTGDDELQGFQQMIVARLNSHRKEMEQEGNLVKSKIMIMKAMLINEFNIKEDTPQMRLFIQEFENMFADALAIKRKRKDKPIEYKGDSIGTEETTQ